MYLHIPHIYQQDKQKYTEVNIFHGFHSCMMLIPRQFLRFLGQEQLHTSCHASACTLRRSDCSLDVLLFPLFIFSMHFLYGNDLGNGPKTVVFLIQCFPPTVLPTCSHSCAKMLK